MLKYQRGRRGGGVWRRGKGGGGVRDRWMVVTGSEGEAYINLKDLMS